MGDLRRFFHLSAKKSHFHMESVSFSSVPTFATTAVTLLEKNLFQPITNLGFKSSGLLKIQHPNQSTVRATSSKVII